MEEKYLAIEIHNEIYVMNNNDELGGLIDNDVPHTVIGKDDRLMSGYPDLSPVLPLLWRS